MTDWCQKAFYSRTSALTTMVFYKVLPLGSRLHFRVLDQRISNPYGRYRKGAWYQDLFYARISVLTRKILYIFSTWYQPAAQSSWPALNETTRKPTTQNFIEMKLVNSSFRHFDRNEHALSETESRIFLELKGLP